MIKCPSYNQDILKKLAIEDHNLEENLVFCSAIDNLTIIDVNRYRQSLDIINVDYLIPGETTDYTCDIKMIDYQRELRNQKIDEIIK